MKKQNQITNPAVVAGAEAIAAVKVGDKIPRNGGIAKQKAAAVVAGAEAKLPAVLNGLPATDSAAVAAAGMAGLIDKLTQNPDIDVTKVQALLDMQLQIWDRMAKMAFTRDFSAMSLVLPRIVKTKGVAYKDKETGKMSEAFTYAVIEDIDEAVRPILPQYGFSLSFTTKTREGGGLISVAKLTHRDGHESVCELPLAIDTSGGKTNLQGMGSTSSYGIRYGTKILLNLITVGEDNDGAGARDEAMDSEQAAEIDTLLRDKIAVFDKDGKNNLKERFLAHFEVDAIPSLKAKDYQAAKVLIASVGQKPQQKKA